MDDWLGRARGGAGEGHPSFSADRSGWWNGGSGTSADDLRLALTGDVATRGVVLQLQAVFQAALDGREDFQAISGLLPDCVSCVFGYSRGGTGGPSGWLERAELSDTGGGDVAGLVELLGPRGSLFRCLLRYHAEYAYEFPLSNFPAHTVREVWALWRRGVRRSDATSSSEVVQHGGAVPSTASPLSRYLAERLRDVHGETACIGAAAYYVFCLLAYPLWHELPESDDRRGGATSAVRPQHVYERLVLAFWRNCSDRVRDQQLCLRAGGAEDAPSLFVCAMLELWFNWNGELAGSSASWAQDRGAAPLRPMAYRPLSRLTLRCQAVVVHDFLQRLSPAALSASLPPGTAGARNGGRLSDARSSPGTLLQASALEPGTLRGADVTSLAAALRGQPAMSARASGTPDSDFDELYRGGGVAVCSHGLVARDRSRLDAAVSLLAAAVGGGAVLATVARRKRRRSASPLATIPPVDPGGVGTPRPTRPPLTIRLATMGAPRRAARRGLSRDVGTAVAVHHPVAVHSAQRSGNAGIPPAVLWSEQPRTGAGFAWGVTPRRTPGPFVVEATWRMVGCRCRRALRGGAGSRPTAREHARAAGADRKASAVGLERHGALFLAVGAREKRALGGSVGAPVR
eukprot:ctg_2606.g767